MVRAQSASAAAWGIALLLACSGIARASTPEPRIFDAHLHYNVEAWEFMPPEKVIALLAAQNVTGALANSRPNAGSWNLLAHQEKAPTQSAPKVKNVHFVPFVRVYRDRSDYGTWFERPEVYAHIVAELDREPRARGIGEFHLSGDQAKHAGVEKIVRLAQARKLWLHAHVDAPALRTLLALHRDAQIIWAHTGFTTPLAEVRAILTEFPNVVGELSYRWDVAEGGALAAGWRALFIQFPSRFVVGSDTWVNQRWESYAETMAQYRRWLGQLPPEVARNIAHENGERMFGLGRAKN